MKTKPASDNGVYVQSAPMGPPLAKSRPGRVTPGAGVSSVTALPDSLSDPWIPPCRADNGRIMATVPWGEVVLYQYVNMEPVESKQAVPGNPGKTLSAETRAEVTS